MTLLHRSRVHIIYTIKIYFLPTDTNSTKSRHYPPTDISGGEGGRYLPCNPRNEEIVLKDREISGNSRNVQI